MPLDVKWPYPPNYKTCKYWSFKSKLILSAVGITSKLWADWTNSVTVYNKETLAKTVTSRPSGTPLVTVSNHHSCIDDPVIWSVLKCRHLVNKNEQVMRWTLAASDVCFTREWHSLCFSLGRVVPVVRGDGVYQRGMEFMLDKLNSGGWVHTFPEGKINVEKTFMRLKWGVGRLIADCTTNPVVLPMWHVGMDDILPNAAPYIPRTGKKVTLLVGDPMDFTEMLQNLKKANCSPREIRQGITDAIQDELAQLQRQAEQIHDSETVKNS